MGDISVDAAAADASPCALMQASLSGDAAAVSALLAGGADPNEASAPSAAAGAACTPSSGINRGAGGPAPPSAMAERPLHAAAANGHAAAVDALLADPRCDVNAASSLGLTALHLAAMADHLDVALALASHAGVDLAAADELGRTAADLAKGRVKNALEGMQAPPAVEQDEPEPEPGLAPSESTVSLDVGGEAEAEADDDDQEDPLGAARMRDPKWKARDQALRDATAMLVNLPADRAPAVVDLFLQGAADKVGHVVGAALGLLTGALDIREVAAGVAGCARVDEALDALLQLAAAANARAAADASAALLAAADSAVGAAAVVARALQLPAAAAGKGSWRPVLARLQALDALFAAAAADEAALMGFVLPALDNANGKVREAAVGLAARLVAERRAGDLEGFQNQYLAAAKPSLLKALAAAVGAAPVPVQPDQAQPHQPDETATDEELPHAEPLSDELQAQAAPIAAAYGDDVARCLFAAAWAPRVAAIQRIRAQMGTETEEDPLTSALLLAVKDRVLNVYQAGLQLLDAAVARFPALAALEDLAAALVPRLGDSRPRTRADTEAALLRLPAPLVAAAVHRTVTEAPAKEPALLVAGRLALLQQLQTQAGVPMAPVMAAAAAAVDNRDKKARAAALDLAAAAVREARAPALAALRSTEPAAAKAKIVAHLVEAALLADEAELEAQDDGEQQQRQPLPYAPPLSDEQEAEHDKLIEVFGAEAVRCVLAREWGPRQAVLVDVELQLRRGEGVPAASPEVLMMTSELLEIAVPDTVSHVFQAALRLLTTLARSYLPTVPGAAFLSRAALEPALVGVCEKLGDSKPRVRCDAEEALLALAGLEHVGAAAVAAAALEVPEGFVKAQGTPMAARLDLLAKLVRADAGGLADVPGVDEVAVAALENRHADVRNAAVDVFCALYAHEPRREALNAALAAGVKPALQTVIRERIVAETVHAPQQPAELGELPDEQPSSVPGVAAQRQLSAVFGDELAAAAVSGHWQQRQAALAEVAERMVGRRGGIAEEHTRGNSAWEVCSMVAKQGLLDSAPQVKVAALTILRVMAAAEHTQHLPQPLVFPWADWEARLVLGSLFKTCADMLGDHNVRVRQGMAELLLQVACSDPVAMGLVARHLLSRVSVPAAPPAAADGRRARTGYQRLARVMASRLRLLLKLLAAGFPVAADTALNVDALVGFAALPLRHRSPLLHKLAAELLTAVCAAAGRATVQQWLRRADADAAALVAQALPELGAPPKVSPRPGGAEGGNTPRTGSASHVHRVAALRPPWSVPSEETKPLQGTSPVAAKPSTAGRRRPTDPAAAAAAADLEAATARPIPRSNDWVSAAAAASSASPSPAVASAGSSSSDDERPAWLTSGWGGGEAQAGDDKPPVGMGARAAAGLRRPRPRVS